MGRLRRWADSGGRAISPKAPVERTASPEIGALPGKGGVLSAKAPRARADRKDSFPTWEVGGPDGPRRRVRARDAGSGDPAFV